MLCLDIEMHYNYPSQSITQQHTHSMKHSSRGILTNTGVFYSVKCTCICIYNICISLSDLLVLMLVVCTHIICIRKYI